MKHEVVEMCQELNPQIAQIFADFLYNRLYREKLLAANFTNERELPAVFFA